MVTRLSTTDSRAYLVLVCIRAATLQYLGEHTVFLHPANGGAAVAN